VPTVSYNRPLSPPCAIIACGETAVRIDNKYGQGGPNQEFALSAASQIIHYDKVIVTAVDTDGTDGPTDIAGGLTDSSTVSRAETNHLDVFKHLHEHDTSTVLLATGDAIITGHTTTNANDPKWC
jgi:glycerate-2-kinase